MSKHDMNDFERKERIKKVLLGTALFLTLVLLLISTIILINLLQIPKSPIGFIGSIAGILIAFIVFMKLRGKE